MVDQEQTDLFISIVMIYFFVIIIILTSLLLYKEYRKEREDRRKWVLGLWYAGLISSIVGMLLTIIYLAFLR